MDQERLHAHIWRGANQDGNLVGENLLRAGAGLVTIDGVQLNLMLRLPFHRLCFPPSCLGPPSGCAARAIVPSQNTCTSMNQQQSRFVETVGTTLVSLYECSLPGENLVGVRLERQRFLHVGEPHSEDFAGGVPPPVLNLDVGGVVMLMRNDLIFRRA